MESILNTYQLLLLLIVVVVVVVEIVAPVAFLDCMTLIFRKCWWGQTSIICM